jgi:hypothetical protein
VDGIVVVAQMQVCEADAVPGRRLTVAVAELLVQDQRLLAVVQCLVVFAEMGGDPADGVEGEGLPKSVADGSEEFEGLPTVKERLSVATLPLVEVGEVVVGVRLTGLVAECT